MRKQDNRTSFRSVPRKQLLARAVQPVVTELLEQRRLFTVTVNLISGVLTVVGDTSANNIEIYQTSGGLVKVKSTTGGTPTTFQNPAWDNEAITKVSVSGGGGTDTIRVGRTSDPLDGDVGVAESCDMYGGNNSCSIYGGDYADTIGGGSLLYGFGGNDSMTGSEIADNMLGGLGNDTMYGGSGDDTIEGEEGNDSMFGELGNDTFYAANSDGDYLDGGSGTDGAHRDSGTDTLVSIETILN